MSRAEEVLESLVGIPSVAGTPNAQIMDFVQTYLEGHGVDCQRMMGPEGDRENLFATIGPRDVPGYILSAHLDVVPANEPEWQADPFRLRVDGDKLLGRGAVDMKGFASAALAAIPDMRQRNLSRPIHLALSYDEELGCRGAPHMIDRLDDLCAKPLGSIVGEPSDMRPVLRHKGKVALHFMAAGVPGHSAQPDQGRNAIHALLPVLNALQVETEKAREDGPFNPLFDPSYSTMQVGTIQGGSAINIIPDHAEMKVEARAIPDVDAMGLLQPVIDQAENDPSLSVSVLAQYPSLSLPEESELATVVFRISGKEPVAAVSYGSEGGLFERAGIPAIICGPGKIERAHKPEEFITRGELDEAYQFVVGLSDFLSA